MIEKPRPGAPDNKAPEFNLVRGGREETAVDELVLGFLSRPLFRAGLKILEAELPRELRYHAADHTHEVLHDAILFAVEDKISGRDLELLAAAALYHDLGFTKSFDDNESIGAEIAAGKMREFGCSQADIKVVQQLILDTRLFISPTSGAYEQRPQTELSKYLCDADLGNLGTKFFLAKALSLFSETHQRDVRGAGDMAGAAGLKFLAETELFLKNHSWHTPAARRLREEQKVINTKELKDFIEVVRALSPASPRES